MPKLTILELFLGAVPENLIFVFGIYVFSNKAFCKKRFILSALIISLCVYLIRLLPIQFGVHMLLCIMIFIVLSIYINHIEVFKSVTSVLLLFIIRLITEWMNLFVLSNIFHIDANVLFYNPLIKVLYALPSTLLFFIIIFIIYLKKYMKRR